MVSASCHQGGDVIWFPRCLNTCVRNLQQLSLPWLDWGTAPPGGFHHSDLVWCADVALWRGLKQSFAEQTQKIPDFGVAGGWKIFEDALCTLSEFLLFPGCLLYTAIWIFNLRGQKKGGRREAAPVGPHIHPQSSLPWKTVMCDGQPWPQCPWTGWVGGKGWHLHSDSKGGAKAAVLQASGVKS